MNDVICKWIDYLETVKRYSPHTLTGYQQDLTQFIGFLQTYRGEEIVLESLKDLKLKDLRSWLADRLAQGFSPRSTARAVSTCRSFFKFLTREYQYDLSIITLLEAPRIRQSLPRPLSTEQAETLITDITAGASEKWVGLRDRALFALLYGTGLRISEALGLKGNILGATDYITVEGKGGKTRIVPLVTAVRESICDYVQACPYPITPTTYLFLGVKGKALQPAVAQLSLRRYRHCVGLPDSVTPHALRHTCATHLMQESSDLRGIQELLGHASLSSTQIYTNIDQNQLRQVFTRAHPRSKA